ncbi:MAG: hypothetical protein LQ344_003441 [Seirophora lacunosa]|nr:MAG: hypothetical protein LQ344_003441 [Seirophora lacunosa]
MPSSAPLPQLPSSTISPPFLSLPDVIRERIYRYVLIIDVHPSSPWITPLPSYRQTARYLPNVPPKPDDNLDNVSKRVRKKRRRRLRAWEQVKETMRAPIPPSSLALLETCRTILLEAFHIWYKHNAFNFRRAEDVYAFLTSISRARAIEVRSIRLDLPCPDWDHAKAAYALKGLIRLERLVFVYNEVLRTYHVTDNWNGIGCPKIISQLRGLQEVTFVDPDHGRWTYELLGRGLRLGMSEGVRLRMEVLRGKMMAEGKKPRPAPPMVDLFGRLKVKDQSAKDTATWAWEENLSYAPEVHGDS